MDFFFSYCKMWDIFTHELILPFLTREDTVTFIFRWTFPVKDIKFIEFVELYSIQSLTLFSAAYTWSYRILKMKRDLKLSFRLHKTNLAFVFFFFFSAPSIWGCRIHRLYRCRGVRHPPNDCPDMTLNNLMVRSQWCWGFGECGLPLHCHCSKVHSGPEW